MSVSLVNTPRYRVTVNGLYLDGVISLQLSLPCAFRIGHFAFTKAFMLAELFPAAWWAATGTKTIQVGVELSVDGVDFQVVMVGNVDNHRYDPIANAVEVAGRDLAASLCDERIVATYRNQTASQIAATLASKHGLGASISPTTTLTGRFYETDHDEIQSGDFCDAVNEWDLLCRLGSQERIIPYVMGNTLYFNRPPEDPPSFSIVVTRDAAGSVASNVSGLALERFMATARDMSVTVRSWNSRKKSTFTATVTSKEMSGEAVSSDAPSEYMLVQPNLTQAQCLSKAQQLALDYALQERCLVATVPSFALLTPTTVIQLSGTGTDYDMTYLLGGVKYSLDFNHGARTEIFARSSSGLQLYDEDTGALIGNGMGS